MVNKNVFSNVKSNIRLNTRSLDDGTEVEVERREDIESHESQKSIIELLTASGYFRAILKGNFLDSTLIYQDYNEIISQVSRISIR